MLSADEAVDAYMTILPELFKSSLIQDGMQLKYQAAYATQSLILKFSEDGDSAKCSKIIGMLENELERGDESLKICLITACLEHVFCHEKARSYFSRWPNIPFLENIYKEASDFSKELSG
jgi:hypothetical protein